MLAQPERYLKPRWLTWSLTAEERFRERSLEPEDLAEVNRQMLSVYLSYMAGWRGTRQRSEREACSISSLEPAVSDLDGDSLRRDRACGHLLGRREKKEACNYIAIQHNSSETYMILQYSPHIVLKGQGACAPRMVQACFLWVSECLSAAFVHTFLGHGQRYRCVRIQQPHVCI